MKGPLLALLPALFSAGAYALSRWLGPVEGLTPPLEALLRSLVGVLAFWDSAPEELATPGLAALYGAYAGAVLEPGGLTGAVVGAFVGLFLCGLRRWARLKRGFLFALLVGVLWGGISAFFPGAWFPVVGLVVVALCVFEKPGD